MSTTTECPVHAQVEAYNNRDIEGFLRCYTEDVVIGHIEKGESMRGLDAMRERYSKLFEETPGLHAHIEKRIRLGEYVIDEEHVTKPPQDTRVVGVVYHVRDGRIDRVTFVS